MNNFESTGGASSTESTEREDFAKVEARLDEIKTMNMGDMSDDDLENVMAERKALRAQKEEMMGSAQEEAMAENQERSNVEKMAADAAEIAKAEAEATAQAEKAKQIEERKQAEAVQAEALLAEIKGGDVDVKQEAPFEKNEDNLTPHNLEDLEVAYKGINGPGSHDADFQRKWKELSREISLKLNNISDIKEAKFYLTSEDQYAIEKKWDELSRHEVEGATSEDEMRSAIKNLRSGGYEEPMRLRKVAIGKYPSLRGPRGY